MRSYRHTSISAGAIGYAIGQPLGVDVNEITVRPAQR